MPSRGVSIETEGTPHAIAQTKRRDALRRQAERTTAGVWLTPAGRLFGCRFILRFLSVAFGGTRTIGRDRLDIA